MALSIPKVTVTAPEGRRTPIDRHDGVEPGGGQLQVTHEHVCRVRYSHTIQRSIARGDLILCNMDGEPVASVEAALAQAAFDTVKRIRKVGAKGGK